ncbi:hypothetical protein AIOL_003320 [Candidatus Rhodobacter oscarellae]|uniref:Transcriptional activator HlyU n=1 Tax=Candidatus Rhodobacter oscarellae TaxID=1675527 RepID=A0A0J9E6N2_9RHOB|nr:HlyU family transcriptional regulator [Candidatus Rhodobacter lobularis]KMW58347.1 hypothetical protein AIOL_003320 [Candidatus Rhodobacter lobularis]
MSFLSKLFGGGGGDGPKKGKSADPVEHSGFRIYAEPISESGGHRIAARIEKDIDGETKTHQMIRADVTSNRDEAVETSVHKAKMLIDQQGETIF